MATVSTSAAGMADAAGTAAAGMTDAASVAAGAAGAAQGRSPNGPSRGASPRRKQPAQIPPAYFLARAPVNAL